MGTPRRKIAGSEQFAGVKRGDGLAMRGAHESGELTTVVVSSGPVAMTIAPNLGARIVSFELDGTNVLLDASAVAGTENANNFGATFWPSPQSAWGWPPVAALDGEPYQIVKEPGALVLKSRPGALLSGARIALTKTIRAVPERSAIDVTYVMQNVGEKAAILAGWQIARVRASGLTFFRLGEGGIGGDRLATVTNNGVQWYEYDAGVVTMQGQKTFADASGWIAHVEDDLVLVQAFPDVPKGGAAEGEAEVELYADPSHTYIEIEPQSHIATVRPGTSSEPWSVRWWLRRLPNGLRASVGHPDLVTFVESIVKS
jgi:hypothetical protein